MRPRRRKYATADSSVPAGEPATSPVTEEEVSRVTSALLSTRDWVERFGGLYGITRTDRLGTTCAGAPPSARRQKSSSLPPGWACAKLGYRIYIFRAEPDLVLPPPAAGKEKKLLPPPVDSTLVERVFAILFPAREWLNTVGKRVYGFTDISYVNQMCWGRPWGNSKVPATLPPGWRAVRVGRSYLIHHDSLGPKARWTNTR